MEKLQGSVFSADIRVKKEYMILKETKLCTFCWLVSENGASAEVYTEGKKYLRAYTQRQEALA